MDKRKILIVDDSELNRRIIKDTLEDDYYVYEAKNGVEALDCIFRNYSEIVLVILDIMMPQLNGVEVMKILKSDKRTECIPVIMLTAADSNEEYCFKLGAADFIKKPFNKNVVLSRVNAHVYKTAYWGSVDSAGKVYSSNDLFLNILYALTAIPDDLHPQKEGDINFEKRLTRLFAAEVCQKLGSEYEKISKHLEIFTSLVPLRDIGKFMVDKNILTKKETLSAEEFAEIMKHCDYGAEIISSFTKPENSPNSALLFDIINDHHENYDGSGYPKGKKGNLISPAGRITAIIDCYMAMTHDRKYRKAFSHVDAIKYIRSQKNKKFDGALADIFLSLPLSGENDVK